MKTPLSRRVLRAVASRIWKPYRLPTSGRLPVAGLESRVQVSWDAHGIPHLFARTEGDLCFGLGFLHAGERLWQMDFLRRASSGRLAEIFGDRPLNWRLISVQYRGKGVADLDFFMRALGLRGAAAASLATLPPDAVELLEAYCRGLNRAVEIQHRQLPLEFRILNYTPEPWTPVDVFLVQRGMAQMLSLSWRAILALSLIAEKLPAGPQRDEMLRALGPWEGKRFGFPLGEEIEGLISLTGDGRDLTGHGASGSNAWALAGSRTRTGHPLLACDPHLPLGLPSVWYLAHLKAEEVDAIGATLPGSPGVVIGRNRHIAWGFTNLMAHDADLYLERVHPQRSDLYRVGDHWEPFEVRPEVIGIRGRPAVLRHLRRGRHGPVLADLSGVSEPLALALRWTGEEPSQECLAILRLNRARNWQEFTEALREFTSPALNVVYADTAGNIGRQAVGKIPVRARGRGSSLLPGWSGEWEWTGTLPYDELPRIFNPAEGRVVLANDRQSAAGTAAYISDYWEPPFRARRIRELLEALHPAGVEEFRAIQNDTFCLQGRDLVSTTLRSWARRIDGELSVAERRALSTLLRWPGDSAPGSAPAALYHVFAQKVLERALFFHVGELLAAHYLELWNLPLQFLDHLLRRPDSPWWAGRDPDRELLEAFREARREVSPRVPGLKARNWGQVHTLLFRHPLGEQALAGALLNEGPLPTGGCSGTVNSGFYSFAFPYHQEAGASYRQIIDLSPAGESWFTLPLGESGNPFHPRSRDLLPGWRQGRLVPMTMPETAAEPALILDPRGSAEKAPDAAADPD